MAWGWWLAGLAVLAVAMFDGARRRALPIGALVVGLAVAYWTTGMYWNVALVGPVNLHGRVVSYLAAYLGAVAVVALAAALTGPWPVPGRPPAVPGHPPIRRRRRPTRPGPRMCRLPAPSSRPISAVGWTDRHTDAARAGGVARRHPRVVQRRDRG